MSDSNAKLTFHGGAGEVTGANFLIETETQKILVDCGLVQGGNFSDDRNWGDFPYVPASIDTLFVTHAHTDHIGRIPRLVKEGFRGKIYSTPPTRDIVEFMFEDALKVMKDELEKREGRQDPLYNEDDIKQALSQWEVFEYHEKIDLKDGVSVHFLDAGHILGSAMVEFARNNKKLVITGDLGNDKALLARKTEELDNVSFLVMESVYGDRNHEGIETRQEVLKNAIELVRRKNGVLLIPAFSLERTQVILYELNNLVEEKKIPSVPIFLDSPLGSKVTVVYSKASRDFNSGVQKEIKSLLRL